jgi:Ni2+-binding GTPase involved in maturation of urease and hydrogenase
MKLVTVSGPPSTGKTSVVLKTLEHLRKEGLKAGVVKFDCLSTSDDLIYEKHGILVKKGLSGALCPDHFFVSNIEEVVAWGLKSGLDLLISESAGLCNRCSPHIKDVLALCVIDNLMGVYTPKKIGPMLKAADIVVVTKGDIVSQAEREVFSRSISVVNPKALVIFLNGITGQGSAELATLIVEGEDLDTVKGKKLRFSMPAALCSYCLGETRIGEAYQHGNVRKMNIDEEPDDSAKH